MAVGRDEGPHTVAKGLVLRSIGEVHEAPLRQVFVVVTAIVTDPGKVSPAQFTTSICEPFARFWPCLQVNHWLGGSLRFGARGRRDITVTHVRGTRPSISPDLICI